MISQSRIEFDIDHYPRIRAWDSEADHDRYLDLHRLVAYAHGEIDDHNGSNWRDLEPGDFVYVYVASDYELDVVFESEEG